MQLSCLQDVLYLETEKWNIFHSLQESFKKYSPICIFAVYISLACTPHWWGAIKSKLQYIDNISGLEKFAYSLTLSLMRDVITPGFPFYAALKPCSDLIQDLLRLETRQKNLCSTAYWKCLKYSFTCSFAVHISEYTSYWWVSITSKL